MTTWPSRARLVDGPPHITSTVPLYRRVSEDMLQLIAQRQLQPGDPLPTEASLCAAYGVSRITIRKALDELSERHVIVRRRGSGTYINDADRITRSVVLSGYIDDVLMLNRMTVLDDRWATLPEHLARFAGAEIGLEFKSIVGVNHIRPDEPIVHIAFWFPPAIADRVGAADVAGPLPTIRHVAQSYGLRLDHASQVMHAVSAPPAIATALGVKRGAPVLRARRAYFDSHQTLIEIFEAHYHPDRYQFAATLYPRQT